MQSEVKVNATHCWVLVCLIALSLAGCVIPVYVDEDEPYLEVATELRVGHTTKDYVLAHYGEPHATYLHGSKFVYSAFEKNWELPYLLPGPGGTGVAVGTGSAGDRHYLILDFDERGILVTQRVEVGKGRADCTESGICFGRAKAGHIVWKADKTADTKAKEFPVSGNQCGMYLYLEKYSLSDQISVSLNGESLGQVNLVGSGFFYILIDPGKHAITANRITPKPVSVTLLVTCKENEHIFVRLKIKGSKSSPALLELVDASKGRKKIKWRLLIIPQSSR